MDSKSLCLFSEIEVVYQLDKNFHSLACSEESQLIFPLENIENKQYGSVESSSQGTSSNKEHVSEVDKHSGLHQIKDKLVITQSIINKEIVNKEVLRDYKLP
ncbi:hypothetical protein EVAR_15773_1 [Eumeta japonica]|uniref:Uncharacterized protein n=1 Tax=Eumeta variegata TaxID=151549 RepID=A0A4C1TZD1_EUMVA|nr:hypothetical protein EVAR_15773_1 [Eumeta japonica]